MLDGFEFIDAGDHAFTALAGGKGMFSKTKGSMWLEAHAIVRHQLRHTRRKILRNYFSVQLISAVKRFNISQTINRLYVAQINEPECFLVALDSSVRMEATVNVTEIYHSTDFYWLDLAD